VFEKVEEGGRVIRIKWVRIHPKWKPAKDKYRSDYHYGYPVKYHDMRFIWLTVIRTKRATHPVLQVGEEFAKVVLSMKVQRWR
jgi:hypothetical protein